MPRRPMDFYETSKEAVDALVEHYLKGTFKSEVQILEPCCGDGAIVKALGELGYTHVWDNDVDVCRIASSHVDARDHKFDYPTPGAAKIHLAVTNPPFNQAFSILKNLHSQVDAVALLLRLTFLEPTKDRGPWLAKNPPNKLIVLPRYSFTGGGKTDSVTCAWMIWDKHFPDRDGVIIVPKKEKTNVAATQGVAGGSDREVPGDPAIDPRLGVPGFGVRER